jgi:Mrp family chromosome partitioning ATPase
MVFSLNYLKTLLLNKLYGGENTIMQQDEQMKQKQAMMQAQDEEIKEKLKDFKNKLLVMSGKGGVGKSTVAAYLAVGLAKKGHQVGLMDVDLHGPSIPRLLGLKGSIQSSAVKDRGH